MSTVGSRHTQSAHSTSSAPSRVASIICRATPAKPLGRPLRLIRGSPGTKGIDRTCNLKPAVSAGIAQPIDSWFTFQTHKIEWFEWFGVVHEWFTNPVVEWFGSHPRKGVNHS